MKNLERVRLVGSLFLYLFASAAAAQSASNLAALSGLVPVSTLNNSKAGRATLDANFAITAQIQNGTARQPILLPFAQQQDLAVSDAFITRQNSYGVADGLGSSLGAAYRRLTGYTSPDDGETDHFGNISPAIANLIIYTNAIEHSDSAAAKFFFANLTLDGKHAVSPTAKEILVEPGGSYDIFGRAYHLSAGSKGANIYGNSRPFLTEPHLTTIVTKDFFGVASGNMAYLRGPSQNLVNSPSYPSGHATYGYAEALVLALLVPERYPQMIVRAAEYGNDRIVLGAHYAMDVLGSRALALYDVAQLLANKPGYVGLKKDRVQIDDFPKALAAARADVDKALGAACHMPIAACAQKDAGRFADPAKDLAFYEATQTYGLPIVFPRTAQSKEDVAKLASEAGYLLTAAFPYLTLAEADRILTETEGPGGGFLDNGSPFGVYSRLDLYQAAKQAITKAPK